MSRMMRSNGEVTEAPPPWAPLGRRSSGGHGRGTGRASPATAFGGWGRGEAVGLTKHVPPDTAVGVGSGDVGVI